MKLIKILFLLLLCTHLNAASEALPWIAWDTKEGLERIHNSHAKANFWNFVRFYESQTRLTYCGVASSVMALNSLFVEAPSSQFLGTYRLFTQEEFFSTNVCEVIDPRDVHARGMNLGELARVLETLLIHVSKYDANRLTHDEMRSQLIESLHNPQKAVLVLYQRKVLKQEGSGHWSPLAAYDKESDSFLIMDVARFKYPPVWVKASTLLDAMQTVDSDGHPRGFLILEKRS